MFETINYSAFRKRQKSFDSEGGTIKYIDEGSGRVILLLHGIPTSGWLYRKMITPLVESGHRVIAPDMLGFGSSDSPKGYDAYREMYQAERLIDLMDSLNVKKWTHVFHDAGGLWTWELLQKYPNRIERLIILNTIIYKNGFKPPVRFGKNLLTKGIMKLYSTKLLNGFLVNQLFKGGLTKNNLSKSDLEGYKRPLLEGKINGLYYFFSNTCHDIKNYETVLKSLNTQSTVIWGKNDVFLLWEPQAEKVKRDLNLADENIHLIEAKHFIQEEKPKTLCDIIIKNTTLKVIK